MAYGARYSYPRRYGGGKSTAQAIYETLNIALGTAFDTSDGSTVTAETSADARAIAAVWSANARMANNRDPQRMTDMLGRWEAIFSIRPHVDDSDNTRRDRVELKFMALGGPLYATLEEICSFLLGDIYIGLEKITLAEANANWPGGTPSKPDMWNSTIAKMLVRVVRPGQEVGITRQEYFENLREMMMFLRDFISSWAVVQWGCFNVGGTRGFKLDEANLDIETFGAP
jgi:hypothetical protein